VAQQVQRGDSISDVERAIEQDPTVAASAASSMAWKFSAT